MAYGSRIHHTYIKADKAYIMYRSINEHIFSLPGLRSTTPVTFDSHAIWGTGIWYPVGLGLRYEGVHKLGYFHIASESRGTLTCQPRHRNIVMEDDRIGVANVKDSHPRQLFGPSPDGRKRGIPSVCPGHCRACRT